MRRPSPTVVVTALVATVFHSIFVVRASFVVADRRVFTLFDDAMISMRYARSFAEGHGLVWNPGGAPVEGFTNLLWTLWMAVPHALGLPDTGAPLFVAATGIVILHAAAWAAHTLARELAPDNADAAGDAAFVLTQTSFALVFWTLRGMEVGLLAAVVTVGTCAVHRLASRPDGARGSAAVAALCTVVGLATRPDAVVPVIVWVGWLLVSGWRTPRVRGGAAGLVAAAAATVAVLTIWRLHTYGDAVPNTYYLKVEGVDVIERLTRGLRYGALSIPRAWLPFLIACVFAAGRAPRRIARPGFALAGLLVAAQFAYSAYVGGDVWEFFRFANRYTATIVPIAAALIATMLAAETERPLAAPLRHGLLVGLVCAGLALAFIADASGAPRTIAYALPAAALLVMALVALAGRLPVRPFAIIAALLVSIASGGPDVARWAAVDGNYHVDTDAEMARLGLLLRAGTAPDAVVAVVQAGNTPYFARRTAVDLLGKSDRVIARAAPRGRFVPGHDRWDYTHSIGALGPDVVVQLWRPTDADYEYVADIGYERLPNGVWVHRDSSRVDRRALAQDWRAPSVFAGLDWGALR